MSLADMTSARSSPAPETCADCDTSASITSDLHKYQVACTCKAPSAQYACAEDPGPPAPAKSGDVPPALPPRPTAALAATNRRNNAALPNATGAPAADGVLSCTRRRKYAWWCVGCGALAAALGGLLAAAHILLRAYTASPHHLETVPAAVPAAMLVLTGVCIMSLARRRNRYSYMIKVVGACCLVCALTCVLVTITTTVIHMNKLQTLKFCEYTKLTRTCTCFSLPPDAHHSGEEDEGVRCVFEGVSDCGVVHGVLYWCLRGVFALSVAAVLVCIFSSMLAYQLLSHERKKMYWEQLELRCRSLYRPPAGAPAPRARPVQAPCACCRQCHPPQPAWDISLQHRFWAPGRIGNLYSPNPGTMRKTSAWSWFPWPRTNSQRCRMGAVPQSGDSAYGFCDTSGENPTETQPNPDPTVPYEDRPSYPANYNPNPTFNQTLPFNNAPFARNIGQTANFSQSTANFSQAAGFGQGSSGFGQTAGFAQASAGFGQASAGYGQEGNGFGEASGSFEGQNGVWGPPPPYSPQGRGGSRHHLHQDPATTTLLHHHHIEMHRNSMPVHSHEHAVASNLAMQPHSCSTRGSSYMGHLIHPNAQITADISHFGPDMANLGPDRDMSLLSPDRRNDVACLQEMGRYPRGAALEAELVHLQSEMARLGSEAARCNTLRGHLVPYNGCQRIMGVSMGNLHRDCGRMQDDSLTIECLRQSGSAKDQSMDSSKQGKENLAFQSDKHSPVRSSLQLDCRGNQQAESEVYFADVSSCCNVSVKADCCGNPNVSALVGTIENHPESTSGESDSGSFTLTRQQRPQPQALGSKRRPRLPPSNDKPRLADLNCSARSQDVRESATNASLREQFSRQDVSRDSATNSSLREHFNRQDGSRDSATNASLREQFHRQDVRDSATNASLREHCNRQDVRDCAKNASSREQFNRQDVRDCTTNASLREQFNRQDARDSATSGSLREQFNRQEQMNNSIREQLNNSLRHSEHNSPIRMCENANLNDLNNSMRLEHHGSPLHKTIRNDLNATVQDRRISDQLNSSIRLEKNLEQPNSSIRLEKNLDLDDSRMRNLDHSILDDSRMRNSPKIKNQNHHMSPGLRKTQNHRSSPKNPLRESPLHARQSSSDSTVSHKNNPEFFVPPPPAHSPLSPGTEESLISDEELERSAEIFKKTEGDILALGPDSQYEPVREVKNEEFKPNHHHCYSDTNTMDSGWQSGSEKHATD